MDFHEAVRNNHLEILKEWPEDELKRAINMHHNNLSPLQVAVKNNRTDMARFLISQGAKVKSLPIKDCDILSVESTKSCLQQACEQLNFEMVRCLAEAGALQEMSQKEKHGLLDLLMAAIQRDNQPMVQFLAQKGADLNFSTDNCWGLLVQAINLQNKPMVTLLLNLGARPDVLDCNDMNALHHAVKFKGETSQSITDLLLESHQNLINAKDEDGCTALWYAVESNNIDTVKRLLDKGAVLDENYDEIDPSELACKIGSKSLVELFLNMDVYQADKSTPLGFAAVKGDIECLEMLCSSEYGDAWLHTNADPLYEAITQPSKDHGNVRYLLQRGIALHQVSQDKNPMQAAVENKDEISLQLLFSFGFDWQKIPAEARSETEQILVRHRAFTVANLLWKNGYQFQPIENTRLQVETYLNIWPRIYIDPIKDDIIKALANLAILDRTVLPLQSLAVVYLRRYLYTTAILPQKSSMSAVVGSLSLPHTVQQLICDVDYGKTSSICSEETKGDGHLLRQPDDSGNADYSESDDEYDGNSDIEANFLNTEPFPDSLFTQRPADENSNDVERFRSFSRKSTKELIGDINFDSSDDEEV